ncbi:MAG: hypothetical protein LIP16_09065 [Clostridium sp.]|nr:hypothetical protein [Clostridium sp.]
MFSRCVALQHFIADYRAGERFDAAGSMDSRSIGRIMFTALYADCMAGFAVNLGTADFLRKLPMPLIAEAIFAVAAPFE